MIFNTILNLKANFFFNKLDEIALSVLLLDFRKQYEDNLNKVYEDVKYEVPIECIEDSKLYIKWIREKVNDDVLVKLYEIFIIKPYGVLDPLLRLPIIEEVNTFPMISGEVTPGECEHIVQVTHAIYGAIDTNIKMHEKLVAYYTQILAVRGGKGISILNPRVRVVLPEGHRVSLEYFTIEEKC